MGLLTAAERERRRLAVIEGLAAGQSMAEIAAGLDVDRYTMVRWARRNDLTAPVRTPPKPQPTRTEAGRVERIATVKAAAAAGLTQAQVARDLGMTRNALGPQWSLARKARKTAQRRVRHPTRIRAAMEPGPEGQEDPRRTCWT